jgi:hypothetical protein
LKANVFARRRGNSERLPIRERSLTADDFSVVLGGPFYQIIRRTHLAGDAFDLVHRRIVLIPLFAWAPLLALAAVNGRAWGNAVAVPFLYDIFVHARFLVALPLLIAAEYVVYKRMRPIIRQFGERGLIAEASHSRFNAANTSAQALRNSILAEAALLLCVYAVGVHYIWPRAGALDVDTWYANPEGAHVNVLAAGWWFLYVSLPLFQFVLLRWYFRILIWTRWLWQIARCDLRLVPTHPDRAGGLGFISSTVMAFAPFLAAHGVLLAGNIANEIAYQGATLPAFKLEIPTVVAFLLIVVLAPLLLFTPHLARARRAGLRRVGTLANRYMQQFDAKWLDRHPRAEPLLGSPDIQSLADLCNAYDVVRSMRLTPFPKETVLELAAVILMPIAPLLLTMLPLEELIKRLLQVLI